MFNDIETMFEIEITPEKLRDIILQLEYHAKMCLPGQTVRKKLDSRTVFIYKPNKPFTDPNDDEFMDKVTYEKIKQANERKEEL